MKVLTGIQPSGTLHLGNYFGAMLPCLRRQHEHQLLAFVVNFHAQTTVDDGERLRQDTVGAVLDWLALGLDPEKAILWVQSDIPEILEFTWYLSNFTPMGLLERCTSYKDKIAKGMAPNHGLFAYPVLMAADILMFGAELIPVGQDQKQHVEVARDIAIKFNNRYGDVLTVPEPVIDDKVATVPGIDGQKMSKSYGNFIAIFEPDEKALRKKVMKVVTDSVPVESPKNPDTCNLFALSKLFLTPLEEADLRRRYQAGGLGYGTVKQELFERIRDHFAPFAKRREELARDRAAVARLLARGAERARDVAAPILSKVRRLVGTAWQE